MSSLEERFAGLGIDNKLQISEDVKLRGTVLEGNSVNFCHGDVEAHKPPSNSLAIFEAGYEKGNQQAFSDFRGGQQIRVNVAQKLSKYTGTKVDAHTNLILTPGTQGALFLAMSSLVERGDKVAIVEPDYFAYREMITFLDGTVTPVTMNYYGHEAEAGIDLKALETAFREGVRVFIFSNPNNPTGALYSFDEIVCIAEMAKKYDVSLIVDELFSRMVFDGKRFTHLCAQKVIPDNLITVIGPSKTEALSGFRLGVAFGSEKIINRMEKLQSIVSLRCAGYCQAVFETWFNEPHGFMKERIYTHQRIRDDIIKELNQVKGVRVRKADAGSYLFIELPPLEIHMKQFVQVLQIQAGISVMPGTNFGEKYSNCIRINFSQDHDAAIAAIRRMGQLVRRYQKR